MRAGGDGENTSRTVSSHHLLSESSLCITEEEEGRFRQTETKDPIERKKNHVGKNLKRGVTNFLNIEQVSSTQKSPSFLLSPLNFIISPGPNSYDFQAGWINKGARDEVKMPTGACDRSVLKESTDLVLENGILDIYSSFAPKKKIFTQVKIIFTAADNFAQKSIFLVCKLKNSRVWYNINICIRYFRIQVPMLETEVGT